MSLPDDRPPVTISQYEMDLLLAIATMYLEAFTGDELMTLPGKLLLQDVEDILAVYGKRY